MTIFLINNDFFKHKQWNINVESLENSVTMTLKRRLLTLIFAC